MLFIFLRKTLRNINDYGFLYTLKRGIFYLLTPIYEKKVYKVYRIELKSFQQETSGNSRFSFKLIEHNDTELIKQIESMEEWLSGKLVSKLKDKSLCMAALDKEKVAAFNLIDFGEIYIPLIKQKKILEKEEAWSEQITVHRKYRKMGLATELRYRVMAELKERGIIRLYGGTLKHNQAMLKLSRKLGFREIVDIHYRKLFFIKKWDYREKTNEHF